MADAVVPGEVPGDSRGYWRRNVWAVALLLLAWFLVSFGVAYDARALSDIDFFGWPLSYWVGAQGALILYFLLVLAYAAWMSRLDRRYGLQAAVGLGVNRQIRRAYLLYTGGFIVFVLTLSFFENQGMPRGTIGYVFLGGTVLLYAAIGILSRTSDPTEFYVAGRAVPSVFNGMATAADWMSAASFISLAGGLYAGGYGGLAFVMGWTGGFVLVALLLAPYLRAFGQYTIPDYLGARFGGHIPRLIAVAITILCSFTYVVAQIYGVGLITSRLTGVEFQIGIFLGLGGILVCSFLGGMKAVTWTQVSQYIVLIIAYMVPVVWLSITQTGSPLPQLSYGQQLREVTRIENALLADPAEAEVRRIYEARAALARERLVDPELAHEQEKTALTNRLLALTAAGASDAEIEGAQDQLLRYPVDSRSARERWQRDLDREARSQPLVRHSEPFPGDDPATREASRRNFLALLFCLMLGTAALPHILIRYYTTPSVAAARSSVAWSLGFILLVYVSAPALAVLVKYTVFTDVVGRAFDDLPVWVRQWQLVDSSLISVEDVNLDGIVQWAEMLIGGDIVVLAAPEIAGMPYVVSGLVAAGGLAAALSTADGLLLTISNALSHDLYFRVINPQALTGRRVMIAKILLLFVAMLAALMAAQRPADILFLVAAAFSFAAAGFFPVMVLGIFWTRATGLGAVAGMVGGLAVTFYYMSTTQLWLRQLIWGIDRSVPVDNLWWGIEPISAGVFGVPVGFVLVVAVSLLTPPPSARTRALVERMRYPVPHG
ncbi:MAG: VC_2705 family sodium/solute symporter [Burkholderiaceae bacterium]